MLAIFAIVRPERSRIVTKALEAAGYNAFSEWSLFGRGRQRGIQVGPVFYEEMPKKMLYIIVADEEKDEVVDIILRSARTGETGCSGDGKIFVQPVLESYTISDEI
jgi:nitrogen regulatory protein PII 1